jgi:cytochrome c-type biogenesis protein CcmH/NrfG
MARHQDTRQVISTSTQRQRAEMKAAVQLPPNYWPAIALVCLSLGVIVGYVIAGSPRSGPPTGAAVAPSEAAAPTQPLVDERQIQTYRDILARDPKNAQAAQQLGNLLYDARRYSEAVHAYQQAIGLDPRNVNVSTDLGTALWYSGRPDEALAQYEESLAIQPDHAQTLFNIGIVKRDGKQDPKGAIAAWEQLLAANPGYPERSKVEQAIQQARQAPVTTPGAAGLDPQNLKPIR